MEVIQQDCICIEVIQEDYIYRGNTRGLYIEVI